MIAIGADHAGYEAKEILKKYLESKAIKYKDFGTFSKDSCHYPIFAEKVAKSVAGGESEKGILVCGSGIGVSIAANKIKGIRAALCYEPELTEMARKHNDANVLCLGAKFSETKKMEEMIDIFLKTAFEGGRHSERVKLIEDMENE